MLSQLIYPNEDSAVSSDEVFLTVAIVLLIRNKRMIVKGTILQAAYRLSLLFSDSVTEKEEVYGVASLA